MSALARPRGLLGLVAGFLVWSSAFILLYGVHALGCAWGWDARQAGPASLGDTTLLRLVLLAVWALHLALAAGVLLGARRLARTPGAGDGATSLARATLALSVAALVATAWTGIPVLAFPLCR